MPKIKVFVNFSVRRPLKKFSNEIFLENDMNHLLKQNFSKEVYNTRRTALSKI